MKSTAETIEVSIGGKPVSCRILRSKRKSVELRVLSASRLQLRCPMLMPRLLIKHFLREREPWLLQRIAQAENAPPALDEKQLAELRRLAAKDLKERAQRLARLMGLSYGRISIRCQRSRWGSCSSKGNLNFNCLLMLCPEQVREYVVLHELCHLREMNHSPRFWAEVERYMPDYARWKLWLKENGGAVMGKLPPAT